MDNLDEESQVREDEPRHSNVLDRESVLQSPGVQKKNFGVFGMILMGAAVVLLFFLFSGKEKPKDGLQKEALDFEPAFKKQVVVPEAPPELSFNQDPLPSEVDLEKAKREEALRQARLKSAILVYGGNGGNAPAPSSEEVASSSASNPASQDPNSRFQEGVEAGITPKVKATSLGSLDQTILQGKLIDGVLETAIHSDLPGMIRAIVSRDVYAESGNQILIPRGARLIGQYNSEQVKGQSRVFVIWSRLVRPDGIEVALNSPGTDPLGQAGLTGKVNNHFWKIFGNSLLLSIIGAATANVGVDTNDQSNSLSTYREQAAEAFQNSSSRILEDAINIQPTIHVKQGTKIKVFVAKDLDFSEALAAPKNLVMVP